MDSFSNIPDTLEYCTPLIEVLPLEDVSTALSSPVPVLAPPPAPQSPILTSDAKNIPSACCANPPATRTLLVPIEEVASDAKDSNEVAERLEDEIAEETALCFLNGSNQSQGACYRAMCLLNHHSGPYSHRTQLGDH